MYNFVRGCIFLFFVLILCFGLTCRKCKDFSSSFLTSQVAFPN